MKVPINKPHNYDEICDVVDSLTEENAKLKAQIEELRDACRQAKALYDHLAMGSLEAAVKYGPNYEPPTDEDCLQVRSLLEEVLKNTEELCNTEL